MVRFVVTSQIQDAIRDYNAKKRCSAEDDAYIKPDSSSIEHMQLAQIASTVNLPLSQLLKGTELYIPAVEKSKPNPEYQARMAELRRKLEEKEYNDMIATVKPAPKISLFSDEDYSSDDAKLVKNQISAIINILFSMVSVFVAIFIWLKNSPDYLRVLWSLFFAAVVGISETGLYLLYWYHLEQRESPKAVKARQKRRTSRIPLEKKVQ